MKHIKQRFSLRCKKKILNVLLPNDYVFCLSYEFRELPDNFLTNLENDFFWSMMEFFNISICFDKKKSVNRVFFQFIQTPSTIVRSEKLILFLKYCLQKLTNGDNLYFRLLSSFLNIYRFKYMCNLMIFEIYLCIE